MGDVVSQSIRIEAPIEDVWNLVMDPERLGDWVTIHESVFDVPDGDLGEGSRFGQRMKLKGVPLKVRWLIAEMEAPRLARWEGEAAAGQGGVELVKGDVAEEGGDGRSLEHAA